jgi:two-component system response regulator NreC
MRVLIVEDHTLVSDALKEVCTSTLGHEVVGATFDARTAIQMALDFRPDLVLLDVELPQLDGFAIAKAMRLVDPTTRILVISSHCDSFTVFRAERTHVNGFVDKNTNTIETLAVAIDNIVRGRVYFSEKFLEVKAARHDDANSFDKVLSDRELEVLCLVGRPMSDPEIAELLGITPATVEKHRNNICAKLGLNSRIETVRYAHAHGFNLVRPIGKER